MISLQSFNETRIKVSNHEQNEFKNLKASPARKLEILCNSVDIKEKYIGKKTDTDRTIRNDKKIGTIKILEKF